MYQIDKELQLNKLHRYHLLCGDEVYLIHAYRQALEKRLSPSPDDMNFLSVSGDEADLDQLADFGMLAPFMSERRVIVIRDSGWFDKGGDKESVKKGSDRLLEILGNLPKTTYIIFAERHVGAKNPRFLYFTGKQKSEIQTLKSADMLVTEFKSLQGPDLIKWIAGYADHGGKRISKKAAYMLPERLGSDMFLLSKELDKLIGYTGQRSEIKESDVEAITGGAVSARVYELTDAVAMGDRVKALTIYRNLVYNKESVDEIFISLMRQFDTMYRLKGFEGSGIPIDSIAEKVGMPPAVRWKARSYMKMAGSFTYPGLEKLVIYLAELDEQVKTEGLARQVAAELFLIKALTK